MIEPSKHPALATTKMRRLNDNRLMGTDRSLWLYRAVPLGPVTEAVSPGESLVPGEPILSMFEELAAQVPTHGMKRRSLAKNNYRQVHMLLLNVPQRFVPPSDHPIAERLGDRYPSVPTDRRLLLFGVRLRDKMTSKGVKGAIDTISQVIVSGTAPLSDFDEDTERMNAAMDRAGLMPLRADDIAFADAWWNYGQNPDTSMLYHPDHVHVFRHPRAVEAAKAAGPASCASWAGDPEHMIPGTHAISFTAVNDQLDLPFLHPTDTRGHWIADLIDSGAFAVSVRGTVEPGAITREELRRQRKRYLDDVRERAAHNKMSRSEQDEALHLLEEVEGLYADDAPPTLAGASVIAAFNGMYRDVDQILGGRDLPVSLSMMDNRQKAAMAETWLCSPFRANPILHDLPAQTLAFSGMPSLNRVGDRTGALLGFTESDDQPAWYNPSAASDQDSLPLTLVAGATGSGKMLPLSSKIPTPTGWTTMGELTEGDWVIGRNGFPCQVTHLWPVNETPDLYRITFSDGQEIIADADHQWLVSNFKGRHGEHSERHAALEAWELARDNIRTIAILANDVPQDEEATLPQMMRWVRERSTDFEWFSGDEFMASLDAVEVPYTLNTRGERTYKLRAAVAGVARRYSEQYWERPADALLIRRTTAEMLAAGLRTEEGARNFAVPVAKALQLPAAESRGDLYALGRALARGGARVVTDDKSSIHVNRVPAELFRGSIEQRLALLTGLANSYREGTDSRVWLDLPSAGLVSDTLSLARSLGVSAWAWKGTERFEPSVHGLESAWRDEFRVVLHHMPSLDEALTGGRQTPTDQWLYITDITPVLPGDADYEPARCITVDSPDHTYLCGDGYVVTSNTMVLLHLADQLAPMGTPVIIVDPKALALTTPVPTPTGWSTIGELAVGDSVLGRDGAACTVTHKSKVFAVGETDVFTVRLDDGQELIADIEHQWVAYSGAERTRLVAADAGAVADWKPRHLGWAQALLDAAEFAGKKEVTTTRGLVSMLRARGVDRWRADARGVAKALRAAGLEPDDDGRRLVWPLIGALEALAEQLRTDADAPFGRVLTTRQMLAEGKRFAFPVPAAIELPEVDLDAIRPYVLAQTGRGARVLRGSIEQRLDALRGYMDADGRTTKRGELMWLGDASTSDVVLEIVRSLGWKARRHVDADGWAHVAFRADATVFCDEAKVRAQAERGGLEIPHRSKFLYVSEIEAQAPVPTQCIRVDSADHTYLVDGFVVSHNTGSDHSAIVEAAGGQVASLDELASADGIFDPIRFSAKKEVGVELATSVLLSVNPWGTHAQDMEVPLQYALGYGVEQGATCIGQALAFAKRDLSAQLPPEMIERVEQQVRYSPMFRAIVGVNPTTQGLRVADSITLIKVGDAHLDLPEPGAVNPSINQRIALALVRMMVYGSAMALTGRNGVIMLDEAWVFLGAGRSEMERLGRLARSQGVHPMLFTQRVSDAVNAGLSGYISRGLIMHIKDEDEAKAACDLFKLGYEGRVSRITTDALKGGTSDDAVGLNWNSMRALKNPRTGDVERGSVCLYVDMAGRAVPTVVNLSPQFLRDASTTPAEAARRRAEREAKRAAEMAQAMSHYGEGPLAQPAPGPGGEAPSEVQRLMPPGAGAWKLPGR